MCSVHRLSRVHQRGFLSGDRLMVFCAPHLTGQCSFVCIISLGLQVQGILIIRLTDQENPRLQRKSVSQAIIAETGVASIHFSYWGLDWCLEGGHHNIISSPCLAYQIIFLAR